MSSINHEHILVSADPGARVDTCIIDSITLAFGKEIDVILVHNGRKYLVSRVGIMTEIKLTCTEKEGE